MEDESPWPSIDPDPAHKSGFMESWNTTSNALETTAASASGTLLVLDDTQHLTGSKALQAEAFARAIFTLTSGMEKARHTTAGRLTDWRLIFWATSNHSLKDLLALGRVTYDASMSARLIEIPVSGRYGVFDCYPEDFTSRQIYRFQCLG